VIGGDRTRKGGTNSGGTQPGRVSDWKESSMEIGKVHLALHLEPVYMLEETKGKHSARFGPGGRQPLVLKELDPTVLGWCHTIVVTSTILDVNLLHAQYVKNHEVDRIGRNLTWARDVVANLVECTQVKESLLLKNSPFHC
jgi:hypothetical protein